MTGIVTTEQLQNASLDAEALEKFISGHDSEDVLTRLSQQYPTLAKATKLLMETGGWDFYSTEAELLAVVPSVTPSVAYAADTKKLYKHNGTLWIDEGLSALDQAKALINKNFSSTYPIIIDRRQLLTSSQLVIYMPRKTIFAKIGNNTFAGDVMSGDTNLPTHVSFNMTTGDVNTLYFDLDLHVYKLAKYPDFPVGSNIIPIVSLWNNYVITNYVGIQLFELNSDCANIFKYSVGDDLLKVPFIYQRTEVVSISHETLASLGITKSYQDSSATNRPYIGDYLDVKRGDYVFFRCYVQTNTASNYKVIQAYLWNSQTVKQTSVLTKVQDIDENLAIFEGYALINTNDIHHFLLGAETQGQQEIRHQIAGIQCFKSKDYIYVALKNDYQRYIKPSLDLTKVNAENIARSNAVANTVITNVQKPTAAYNTKIVYGQSLARGQETFPALSTANKFGNMMLGTNVLPNGYDANSTGDYVPFGDSSLHQLVANVVNGNGDTLLNDTQVNALPRGDGSFGEPPNHGWVNGAKYYLNQMLMKANDSRVFVTYNASVSGRTIEQLSKDQTIDSNNRFGRFKNGISKIHTAANGDHVVDGIFWAQGEFNYIYGATGTSPVASSKADYKSKFEQIINDMWTACQEVTGQPNVPAFFTYQTGANYTVDNDASGTPGLNIGMAQLELALQKENVFLVSPIYHLTDKGGHLDANGSRWLGNYIAKVHHKVVHLGQNWEPLHPTSISKKGNEIFISFHVPHPPLQFKGQYDKSAPIMQGNYGFKVTDKDSGAMLDISSVDIVADTVVRITLAKSTSDSIEAGSEPVGSRINVWYASQLTGGQGNLCDSDPFVAFDKYEYKEGTSMYPEANIADLVDKPYPLQNWCVAFFYPVGYSE
ncbi:sialate O-acetylesterase family protein [Acinetobacter sp. ANC 4639]